MEKNRHTTMPPDSDQKPEPRERRNRAAAVSDVLSPAMPAVGAGLMIEADPRLNEVSETEEALKRAIEPVEPDGSDNRPEKGERDRRKR